MDEDIEDVLRRSRRPNIWKMFKPTDVYLYDLIYEPYLGRETYLEGGGDS